MTNEYITSDLEDEGEILTSEQVAAIMAEGKVDHYAIEDAQRPAREAQAERRQKAQEYVNRQSWAYGKYRGPF